MAPRRRRPTSVGGEGPRARARNLPEEDARRPVDECRPASTEGLTRQGKIPPHPHQPRHNLLPQIAAGMPQSLNFHGFWRANDWFLWLFLSAAAVLESLRNGTFSPDDTGRFAPIVESLLGHDRFMVAADFEAYWKAQRAVDALWRSPRDWWRMSILNTARMSWFSSDRAIREYAREIWHVPVGL